MATLNKIAYLAPEIPALSATFVYKEILALSKLGFDILPFSVHFPKHITQGNIGDQLRGKTIYLYRQSEYKIFRNHLTFIIKHPVRYLFVLRLAVSDALKTRGWRIGLGLLYRFFISVRCAYLLKKNECGHIHVHFAHIPTDIAMYASQLAMIPFSFTAHANDIFERGWLLKEKVDRSLFAICISEYNRKYLISNGADSKKIQTIHCGIETDTFKPTNREALATPPRVGILCRLVEKKGVNCLIRACKILLDKGQKIHLVIVGNGPLKKNMESLVQNLNISDNVSFQGPMPHADVPDWIASLDLFVLPSKKDSRKDQDGIPVVLMEAMASGINVISTRISGIPELVEHEKTGLVVTPDSPEKTATAIQRLLSEPKLRTQLRQNAMLKVQSYFNLTVNAAELGKRLEASIS